MNALQSLSKSMESCRNTARIATFAIQDFRRMTALRAYKASAEAKTPAVRRIEPGILWAVNRWLLTGDVRIEFYSSNTSGEIRVKVIDVEGVNSCDISLASFVSSSPLTR